MLTRGAGVVAAAIALGTAIAYVILVSAEEGNDGLVVILVVAMIVGAAVAAWRGASVTDPVRKRALLGVASGVLLSLGTLAIFSIGLLLLVAGIVSTVAWVRAMVTRGQGGRVVGTAAFVVSAALPLVLFLVPGQ